MSDCDKQYISKGRLARSIKLLVALWCGGIVLFGGIGILLNFAESQEEQIRLLLMLVLLPLSILIVRLVAYLLGWRPINFS